MTVSTYDYVGLCFYRAVYDGVVVRILSYDLMCLRRIDYQGVRLHVPNQDLNCLGGQAELATRQHVLVLIQY